MLKSYKWMGWMQWKNRGPRGVPKEKRQVSRRGEPFFYQIPRISNYKRGVGGSWAESFHICNQVCCRDCKWPSCFCNAAKPHPKGLPVAEMGHKGMLNAVLQKSLRGKEGAFGTNVRTTVELVKRKCKNVENYRQVR